MAAITSMLPSISTKDVTVGLNYAVENMTTLAISLVSFVIVILVLVQMVSYGRMYKNVRHPVQHSRPVRRGSEAVDRFFKNYIYLVSKRVLFCGSQCQGHGCVGWWRFCVRRKRNSNNHDLDSVQNYGSH